MVIGEVVENYPAVAEVLAESGLGCMDCSASGEETILQGFMSHGLAESDVENLLAEINKKISEMKANPLSQKRSLQTPKGSLQYNNYKKENLAPGANKKITGL